MAGDRGAPRCERILALYRGDFLAEDRDAGWAAPLRNRLRRRFARMISVRAEMNDAAGLDWYRRGLDAAPEAEEIYQGLMRYHLAQVRGAEGVAVYERLRDMLHDTDGSIPGATSETLYRKLREIERRSP